MDQSSKQWVNALADNGPNVDNVSIWVSLRGSGLTYQPENGPNADRMYRFGSVLEANQSAIVSDPGSMVALVESLSQLTWLDFFLFFFLSIRRKRGGFLLSGATTENSHPWTKLALNSPTRVELLRPQAEQSAKRVLG